jgi:hypothetical protein
LKEPSLLEDRKIDFADGKPHEQDISVNIEVILLIGEGFIE